IDRSDWNMLSVDRLLLTPPFLSLRFGIFLLLLAAACSRVEVFDHRMHVADFIFSMLLIPFPCERHFIDGANGGTQLSCQLIPEFLSTSFFSLQPYCPALIGRINIDLHYLHIF